MICRRLGAGPLLTRSDLALADSRFADASSVFNPGALTAGGRIHLMLRVQSRGRETGLVMAESADGLRFRIARELLAFAGLEHLEGRVHHVYDPRLTTLEGRHYALLALDLDDRCELGLAASENLAQWEFLGLVSAGGNRNGVLFPERIGGCALRLDRPNRLGVSGDEIWLSSSVDLLRWEPVAPVANGRPRSWDELIGPGPPPILTRAGWLLVYHGVATHYGGVSIYQTGALLLDAKDPSRLLARTRRNILEPREPWELVGQVPNVVFPSGLVLPEHAGPDPAPDAARVLLYYGAADTCVGLAETSVGALLAACAEA